MQTQKIVMFIDRVPLFRFCMLTRIIILFLSGKYSYTLHILCCGDVCVLWRIINILLTSLFSLRFYYCCKPKKTLIYEWIAGFAGFVDVFLFIRFYTTYIVCVLWIRVVPRVFKTSRHFSYIRSLHAVYDVLCVCSLFFV